MRVLLKFVLDCDVDAAWEAIRSPSVFRAVSWPFTTFESMESGGFPERWGEGEHPVAVKAFGLVGVGEQVIRISTSSITEGGISTSSITEGGISTSSITGSGGVRIVHDTGHGVSGPLALVTDWHHSMAVSPTADGRTLYRDQLRFGAGILTPLLWPVYWAFWQWRGVRIRQLASTWR